jgi:hypothetical protein
MRILGVLALFIVWVSARAQEPLLAPGQVVFTCSREGLRVPLTLADGSVVFLSPGEHNVL